MIRSNGFMYAMAFCVALLVATGCWLIYGSGLFRSAFPDAVGAVERVSNESIVSWNNKMNSEGGHSASVGAPLSLPVETVPDEMASSEGISMEEDVSEGSEPSDEPVAESGQLGEGAASEEA